MMTGRRRLLSRGKIPHAEPQRTWLPPLDFRVLFPLVASAVVVGYFYPFSGLDLLVDHPFPSLEVFLVPLYVGVIAFRNRLELHPDALYVWTLTRVRRLPLADIADVQAGENGLNLTLRDGSVVTTWLVGGKRRPHRTRRTRADRLADEVRALVLPDRS